MEILPVLFFLLGTLHGIRAPDCDHDGVPDDEDVDDDNDGIVDEGEPCGDSDGDGVLNMDDPDYHSHDYNEAQFEEYDGEGVWALDSYNFDEGAVSAGCEDYGDCDEDGDGADDEEHIEEDSGKSHGDFDQDGIPDFLDSDDNDDGVPDEMDNDDDNDGIIDEEDPDHNDGVPALTAGPQNVEFTSACDDMGCWIRVDWSPPPRNAWMSCLLGYRVGITQLSWRVGQMTRWTTDWIWTNDRGTHHDLRLNKFFFYEEPEGTNHSLTMRDLDHRTTYEVKILTFNPEGGVHEESHEVNTPSGWCRIA